MLFFVYKRITCNNDRLNINLNVGNHTISFQSSTTVDTTFDGEDDVDFSNLSATYTPDTTPPTTTYSPNSSGWTNKQVSVSVTPSDTGGCGVKQYTYRTSSNGGTTWGNWSGTITGSGSTTVTLGGQGTWQIQTQALDNAGNTGTSTSGQYLIDTTAPTAPSITPSTTSWTNQNVTFTLGTATDDLSGVAYEQYQIDSGAWTNYSSTVTISTEGTHTINSRAVDNAGNISTTTSKTIHIDATAPTGSCTLSTSAPTGKSVTISVTASDGLSGIQYIKKPDNSTVAGVSATYTVSSNGIYNFVVVDNANNQYALPVTITNIDSMISVTHPINVAYTADPTNNQFAAPNISLANNSTDVPIKVTLQSFSSSLVGTNGFNLGTHVTESTTGQSTWSSINTTSTLWTGASTTLLGSINPNGTGNLTLTSVFNRSWSTQKIDSGSLVLEFEPAQ